MDRNMKLNNLQCRAKRESTISGTSCLSQYSNENIIEYHYPYWIMYVTDRTDFEECIIIPQSPGRLQI